MSETAKSFWHSAGYIPWFTADTASAVGAALRALAISLLGYAVSGSTIAAGWLGTSSMIAQQVASVFGGTFVDRHDRKRRIVVPRVAVDRGARIRHQRISWERYGCDASLDYRYPLLSQGAEPQRGA